MEILKFPRGFKWGSATSAHQIEGGNHNDWSEWEHANSARLAAEAASWYANAPMRIKEESAKPENFISGKACDSFNRYEEDFDIAKKLNQNIHRFSIEWSRIEPEEGRFDSEAMQHYIDVVKSLRGRGIEPMITLWHFTNPIWFSNKGGFLNKKSPEYFTRYAKYVADNLKDKVSLWITFNEATTVYSGSSYLKGVWPPQFRSVMAFYRCNKNIIQSHTQTYKEIKKLYSQSPANDDKSFGSEDVPQVSHENTAMSHNVERRVLVGITENNCFVIAGALFSILGIDKLFNYFRNLYLWKKAFPYYDFLGLNYYTTYRLPGSFKKLTKGEWVSEMDWEIYPEGVYHCLKKLRRFNRPVYITENGIADKTDLKREKFIKDHLYWVWKAIQDGIDVRGYLYWSLLDNFEWAHGFGPRFGLAEINYQNNCERKIRPSAFEYAKICLSNQLETDQLETD